MIKIGNESKERRIGSLFLAFSAHDSFAPLIPFVPNELGKLVLYGDESVTN
jgi:hypothetical protein